jgi:hypothetical protein
MKTSRIIVAAGLLAGIAGAAGGQDATGLLQQGFDLAASRSADVQYFTMESRMVTHGPDGKPIGATVYRLRLECEPGAAASDGDRYTCLGFTVQHGEEPPVAIPSLSGWSYVFRHSANWRDEKGQTLGIDHKPFEHLVDARGTALQPGDAYGVYNAFIDFHSFQVFTTRSETGNGIQDLTHVGQKIVHSSSHSRPATNLGGIVGEGSYFENGEVTLELKGLGLVDGRTCAIVGYDSGASSFLMLMKPAPTVEVRTVGSSHYWGDIYQDVATRWVRKASLTELVVSQTTVPGAPKPLDAVTERSILVLNVSSQAARAPLP